MIDTITPELANLPQSEIDRYSHFYPWIPGSVDSFRLQAAVAREGVKAGDIIYNGRMMGPIIATQEMADDCNAMPAEWFTKLANGEWFPLPCAPEADEPLSVEGGR